MLSKEVDQDISNSQEPFFVWVCFVLFCFAHERVLIFFWEGGGGGGVCDNTGANFGAFDLLHVSF